LPFRITEIWFSESEEDQKRAVQAVARLTASQPREPVFLFGGRRSSRLSELVAAKRCRRNRFIGGLGRKHGFCDDFYAATR